MNRIIDDMPPDREACKRTVSSSRLGSRLEPWPYPLAGLYDIALEIEGKDATGRQVYDRAGLILGLFIRECIMTRKEKWQIHNQDSSRTEPHREVTEGIYIEQ